jgi:hypothetical protein
MGHWLFLLREQTLVGVGGQRASAAASAQEFPCSENNLDLILLHLLGSAASTADFRLLTCSGPPPCRNNIPFLLGHSRARGQTDRRASPEQRARWGYRVVPWNALVGVGRSYFLLLLPSAQSFFRVRCFNLVTSSADLLTAADFRPLPARTDNLARNNTAPVVTAEL